ncbi:DegV family protein [Candidatus Soleaferrea massiliensis]|uniref:DegV family protein n=1 Tax=Candidatus Soleaferrea massiliensis TaxID=1470354 RepID=UPI0005918065|nr:DegV family protein [Candidatus Soleaferrea massiliensis]
MQKIKIITDSACDIPEKLEKELHIKILPIPLTVDGESYFERRDFTNQEFYEVLQNCKTIPTTSHITSHVFQKAYEKAFERGYTDVIHITIASSGSNMYEAAQLARNLFFEEHEEAKDRFHIHIIDSETYTMCFGKAAVDAAKLAAEGKSAKEIVAHIEGYFKKLETYFAVFTLEFAKKSGRISVAAAFVGEKLGLRPIFSITGNRIKIGQKVRGDKNIIPKLVAGVKENIVEGSAYIILKGVLEEPALQLAKALKKELGYPPEGIYEVGASIAINSGPQVIGVGFQSKNKA